MDPSFAVDVSDAFKELSGKLEDESYWQATGLMIVLVELSLLVE